MLDAVSGGRLDAVLVVCGGSEYYSYGINPAKARRRFLEALDLVIQAWTTPGPFEFHGEFTQLRFCHPSPRPRQQPHAPV